jgi:hypothetical protein
MGRPDVAEEAGHGAQLVQFPLARPASGHMRGQLGGLGAVEPPEGVDAEPDPVLAAVISSHVPQYVF